MPGRTAVALATLAVVATAACSAPSERVAERAAQDSAQDSAQEAPVERRTASPSVPDTSRPAPSESAPTPTTSPTAEPEPPEPRRSFVSVPALGLRDVPVVRYRGAPDDGPGTAIQNGGPMASPRGPRGGVGPGEVGNFIVTGHRLTGTAPLRYAPSLRRGDRIRVRSGDRVFVYEVRRTRWTSFRRPESLAAQRAPVPGRPGRTATRAMITVSTCATIEDHAAGNYWSDQYDNPEHRIDKIGVLVDVRPA